MNEVVQKQNTEVLKALEDICKIKSNETDEITRAVAEGYFEASRIMTAFVAAEYERIESEVKQAQLHLIEKLAERRQIMKVLDIVARAEGFQGALLDSLKEKGGK